MGDVVSSMHLRGKQYGLVQFAPSDITRTYQGWLMDPEVNKHLSVRHHLPTWDELKDYVGSFDHQNRFLWYIVDEAAGRKIGTMSLNADPNPRFANFGYLIGEKEYWGRKSAISATVLMLDFGFHHLEFEKIWGGADKNNFGSIFNFKKLKFVLDGNVRSEAGRPPYPGAPILDFSMTPQRWKEVREPFVPLYL
jgi:RimJ/RimL family protein N-acetyltransferase